MHNYVATTTCGWFWAIVVEVCIEEHEYEIMHNLCLEITFSARH